MLITRVYRCVRRIQMKRHCLEDISPFCRATHTPPPCFELLVTSAAGFKAMVTHLHSCMQ